MTTPLPVDFVSLWSARSRWVWSYIYSLVSNASDADDIFQETGITLSQKFNEFQPGTSFSAWACRVAYLKVLEFRKRRQLADHVDPEFLEAISDEARRAVEASDPRFEALAECLGKLSAKERKLIELRYRGDVSVKSVAEKIGRSVALVYKSLARIHETLFECIRRRVAEGEQA